MQKSLWHEHPTAWDFWVFEVEGGGFGPHTHEGFHEWMLVLDGAINHRIGEERFIQRPGDLVLVREHETHEFQPVPAAQKRACRVVNLPFRVEWVERLDRLLHGAASFHAWMESPAPLRVQVPPSRWSGLCEELDRLLGHTGDLNAPLLASRFFLSCLDAAGLCASAGKETMRAAPFWLRNLTLELDQNGALSPTVHEMAQRAQCTPEHLSRSFKRYLGVTPSQYLNERRLRQAVHLLTHTNRRVSDIARVLGYEEPTYFTRLFKGAYGKSPKEYRNAHGAPSPLVLLS